MDDQALKTLSDELQSGINAIRDKQKILEDKKLDRDVIDKELTPTITKVQQAVDELEVKLKKHTTESRSSGEQNPEHKAFMDWLRYGQKSDLLKKADGLETKTAYRVSDDTTGGYLTSPEVAAGILKTITEFSPIRSIASVVNTGRESWEITSRTAVFSANWVGEIANRTEATGLAFGKERIPVHEAAVYVDVSQQLLEDSDTDFESFLSAEFGERFGVLEANSFVSGNTTYKPQGILTDGNIANTAGGDANNVTADGLITLYFAPKSGYITNSRYVMARATMAYCAKLKNNDNDYLLRRLGETPGWTILGAPVVEAVDMPAMANAAYPVLFGDFRRGYQIVDRVGLTILRDPYSAALNGAVRFHARKRVGGKVIMPESIYKMKMAAS